MDICKLYLIAFDDPFQLCAPQLGAETNQTGFSRSMHHMLSGRAQPASLDFVLYESCICATRVPVVLGTVTLARQPGFGSHFNEGEQRA